MQSCVRGPDTHHVLPLRNRLEIAVFLSDIRPVLKKCGANDDNCVAEWDEVG